MLLWIIVAAWFICGIFSNVLTKKTKLSFSYRLLLLLEGAIGLVFLIIFREEINK